MKKLVAGLSVFLTVLMIFPAILVTFPAPVCAASARDTLQTQVNRVLEVLRNGADTKAAKEKKVLSIADEIFDYNELSRRTVSNYWKSFMPEQQKEFTSLFGRLLAGVYMDRIMEYTNEKVVFGKETKLTENTAEVQTEIVTQTKTVPLNYRMILQNGQWKVYDVSVEGISLVMNYRSQFRDILASKAPEDLLKTLRQKVRK